MYKSIAKELQLLMALCELDAAELARACKFDISKSNRLTQPVKSYDHLRRRAPSYLMAAHVLKQHALDRDQPRVDLFIRAITFIRDNYECYEERRKWNNLK